MYLEAMHYAKPVIAANCGAAPEVVKHGETGLLVDYGNAEQLADVIVALCLDSGLRTRLGEAGQLRMQSNFSLNQFREKFSQIVQREMAAARVGANGRGLLARASTPQ